MVVCSISCVFFFQAEDGIRDLVRSRGLGDVYKRQAHQGAGAIQPGFSADHIRSLGLQLGNIETSGTMGCLLYTSDAADERSSVDLGGRRIIKKKKKDTNTGKRYTNTKTQRDEGTETILQQ